jgi:hypothetical protein
VCFAVFCSSILAFRCNTHNREIAILLALRVVKKALGVFSAHINAVDRQVSASSLTARHFIVSTFKLEKFFI